MKISETNLLIALMLFIHFSLNAQDEKIFLPTSKVYIGEMTETDERITATMLEFNEPVYEAFYLDSLNDLVVCTRKYREAIQSFAPKGHVYKLDRNTGEVLFEQKHDFKNARFVFTQDHFLEVVKNRGIIVYDIREQKETIRLMAEPVFISTEKNKVIAFEVDNENDVSERLNAYDLSNENILWSTRVQHEFGWGPLRIVDDSLMLMVADGLYGINLNTGQAWHLNEPTGYTNWSGPDDVTIESTRNPISEDRTDGRENHMSAVHSNILVVDSSIVFASAQNIQRLDPSGNILWQMELPYFPAGHSRMHVTDSMLFLLNYGVGIFNRKLKHVGQPFIAAYSLQDGHCLYNIVFEDSRKVDVPDFFYSDEVIYSVNRRELVAHNKSDGRELGRKKFPFLDSQYFRLLERKQYQTKKGELIEIVPDVESSITFAVSTGMEEWILQLHPITLEEIKRFKPKRFRNRWYNIQSLNNHEILMSLSSDPTCAIIERETRRLVATFDVERIAVFPIINTALALEKNQLFIINTDFLPVQVMD